MVPGQSGGWSGRGGCEQPVDVEEAVAMVVRIGLAAEAAANTERICPDCRGIMRLMQDPVSGAAVWVCRRCGHTSGS